MPRPLLVLALCLAAFAVPVAAGCGGDDAGGASNGGGGAAAGEVDGTGYSVGLPEDWDDHSERAEDFASGGFQPDVVLIAEPDDGFATNVNVLRQPDLGEGVDAERLARASLQAYRASAGGEQGGDGLQATDISELRELQLDGEPARAFDYSSEREGRQLRFRQVYAVHEGTGYVITFAALADDFQQRVDALDEVVGSWSWE